MRKACSIILLLFLACDDIIEVQDISEDSVIILAPTNEVVLSNTLVNFNWEPILDAESYHLQIAQPNFQEAAQIVRDTMLTDSNFNTTLETEEYQWRIRAENSAYTTDYTIQSFSIEE